MVHGIAWYALNHFFSLSDRGGDLAGIEVLYDGRRSTYSFSFPEEQRVEWSGIELLGGTERSNFLVSRCTRVGSKLSNHGQSVSESEKRTLAFTPTIHAERENETDEGNTMLHLLF
jgi:hypothetical protein